MGNKFISRIFRSKNFKKNWNIGILKQNKNSLCVYFRKEILFFEKKYKFKINIIPDNDLIIPEYKIHLLNKNKKIIKKIENFKTIVAKNNNIIDIDKSKKDKKKIGETLGKILWTKRKARSN